MIMLATPGRELGKESQLSKLQITTFPNWKRVSREKGRGGWQKTLGCRDTQREKRGKRKHEKTKSGKDHIVEHEVQPY